ncbi:MAG: NAD(P)/FAD-dependent oxidoreductase [Burkholderiales bacterium]|nr:NAD(P)/FAD-dependent oxidoreductase [Burkholderiales bacterium]
MHKVDVVVVGAGAAGLFCAARAGQAGLKVLLIDHAEKLAEKIRISGGGRCNFTNRDTTPAQYLSDNPHYCRSALAGYTPADFIALVERHHIPWHEKHKGQLFCDDSAEDIIQMLVAECAAGRVERWQPCAVRGVSQGPGGFELQTDRGPVHAAQLVVATGGLPVPKIGASDWGLRLARQWGHRIVEPRPALVPLTFDAVAWQPFAELAGVALPVRVSVAPQPAHLDGGKAAGSPGDAPGAAAARTQAEQPAGAGARGSKGRSGKAAVAFHEDLLFTHRGLSGPAILQISSYWRAGDGLRIDLAAGDTPADDLGQALCQAKRGSRRQLANELAARLPQRLVQTWCALHGLPGHKPLPDCRDAELLAAGRSLQQWTVLPTGTEGWRKAEVMAGGVDTRDLESRSMGSRLVPGLYFIGEVVDVTGWLGGYNFQWAWASGAACARALAQRAAGMA